MNTSHEETVYIVSGFMRTGTSMMMRCLELGGMEAVYSREKDESKNDFSDESYDPNEGGLYEMDREDYHVPNFPDMHKGKLIKLLNLGTFGLKPMPKLKVVFMRRDPEEVRQSYVAFFGDIKKERMTVENIGQAMALNIQLLNNRKDTDVLEFWYRDVVEDPRKYFTLLKENGWPIDVEKCVSGVNKDLLRFKIEELTPGI